MGWIVIEWVAMKWIVKEWFITELIAMEWIAMEWIAMALENESCLSFPLSPGLVRERDFTTQTGWREGGMTARGAS
ncbi:hypothetical protein AOXY_G28128 [Acipenser oxyrinchus oxyrinchus]|uniref:Uncharacterized protein n=1 Tax=Acipenser oxyrinchus oxyrinchus TaxID=40147 RepID=A0AAD8FSY3_ACIOX|nr:hypothetical protein AOXY_G28128 [Acipenser oxyrinchus oxyrinchus]